MAQTSVMFQRSHKQIWVLPVSVPGVVVAEGVEMVFLLSLLLMKEISVTRAFR